MVGPDSGLPPTTPNTWAFDLDPGAPPPGGIKFIIVHLQNLSIPANNRVEIDLGYDKDVITAANGHEAVAQARQLERRGRRRAGASAAS